MVWSTPVGRQSYAIDGYGEGSDCESSGLRLPRSEPGRGPRGPRVLKHHFPECATELLLSPAGAARHWGEPGRAEEHRSRRFHSVDMNHVAKNGSMARRGDPVSGPLG